MGKRGPAKKPTELKRLEGTFRADRAARNQAAPTREAPNCPTWLGREAKRIWRRLAPELESCGLLTKADRATFAAFCQAYHDWWELERRKEDCPKTFTTENGYTQKHPIWGMASEARQEMMKHAAKFGMTPSDRAGIDLPPPGDSGEDPVEWLLAGSGRN